MIAAHEPAYIAAETRKSNLTERFNPAGHRLLLLHCPVDRRRVSLRYDCLETYRSPSHRYCCGSRRPWLSFVVSDR